MRILVVEDEQDLNNIICKKLSASGYSTDSCYDGKEAMEYMEAAEYDAVIMDVTMPFLDGFTLLQMIRSRGDDTPVIFLTARDSIEDRVHGLDIGASDYVIKPFSLAELMARVRAVTRKASGNSTNIYKIADLTVDTAAKTVVRGGREIALSAKEFSLLEFMIRNQGIVLSRERIENNIWNFDYEGGTNVIDVYIRYLRRKIDEGFDSKLIHTVRGSGYVLREEK